MVLIRNRLQTQGLQKFHTEFDVDQGFTAWLGPQRPDEPKFYETLDSSWLSLLIEGVPGVGDP